MEGHAQPQIWLHCSGRDSLSNELNLEAEQREWDLFILETFAWWYAPGKELESVSTIFYSSWLSDLAVENLYFHVENMKSNDFVGTILSE